MYHFNSIWRVTYFTFTSEHLVCVTNIAFWQYNRYIILLFVRCSHLYSRCARGGKFVHDRWYTKVCSLSLFLSVCLWAYFETLCTPFRFPTLALALSRDSNGLPSNGMLHNKKKTHTWHTYMYILSVFPV